MNSKKTFYAAEKMYAQISKLSPVSQRNVIAVLNTIVNCNEETLGSIRDLSLSLMAGMFDKIPKALQGALHKFFNTEQKKLAVKAVKDAKKESKKFLSFPYPPYRPTKRERARNKAILKRDYLTLGKRIVKGK